MEIFCLLFRRYLPKNNQRRREKTHVEESRSSHISGTDVLTLKAKERLIERCRNRGKTTSVESCNRHTYTKHSHTQTIVEHLHQERKLKHKTRTNNVLFSILVYCPSWRKARRRRLRDGAADRRVKKENTEKIVIL